MNGMKETDGMMGSMGKSKVMEESMKPSSMGMPDGGKKEGNMMPGMPDMSKTPNKKGVK